MLPAGWSEVVTKLTVPLAFCAAVGRLGAAAVVARLGAAVPLIVVEVVAGEVAAGVVDHACGAGLGARARSGTRRRFHRCRHSPPLPLALPLRTSAPPGAPTLAPLLTAAPLVPAPVAPPAGRPLRREPPPVLAPLVGRSVPAAPRAGGGSPSRQNHPTHSMSLALASRRRAPRCRLREARWRRTAAGRCAHAASQHLRERLFHPLGRKNIVSWCSRPPYPRGRLAQCNPFDIPST